MVGGRLRCLSCFFTHSELLLHLLLLGVCFHDVEASGCELTVHKQVGDTVEFPSCLSPGKVNLARWEFNKSLKNIMEDLRFEGRVHVNPPNFSLTVKKLTLQDSGDFLFLSEVNNNQKPTVIIHLHVQEPSPPPVLSFNSTFHPSNGSCTVWLECVSTPDSNVSYSWSVRNQTLVGPRLRYTIRPQDGGTNFTCTISSSESSTSETVTCVNSSSDSVEEKRALALDPTVHHDEVQLPVYSSLLHGDICIYDSIRGDTEEGTRGGPEETSDYVNENPHSASGGL